MSPNTPTAAQPLPVRLRVLAGQLNRRRRRTCGDPQGMRRESSWTDEFGEHFEVRVMALGRLFSRKITRDPACGWTVTWDEVRRSVDGAIADASRHALKGYPTMNTPTAALEELKPCPFCGGKATRGTYQDESLWSHNIVTKTTVGCGDCNFQFDTEPGYELEAPEAWNRRALEALAAQPQPPIRELIYSMLGEDHERGCAGRNYECSCGYDARVRELAERARAAQPQQAVVGWKLVPVEPTEAMLTAVVLDEIGSATFKWTKMTEAQIMTRARHRIWSAMLASAPAGPEGEGPDHIVDADEMVREPFCSGPCLAQRGSQAWKQCPNGRGCNFDDPHRGYIKSTPGPIQAQGGEPGIELLRRIMRVLDGPTAHRDLAKLDVRAHPVFDDVREYLAAIRSPIPEPPLTSAHPSAGKWNPTTGVYDMPAPDEGERWPEFPDSPWGMRLFGMEIYTEAQLRAFAREYRRLNVGQRVEGERG